MEAKNYEFKGKSITIFDLNGLPSGKNWIIGIPLFGESYTLAEVDKEPVSKKVTSIIKDDEANGNLDKIDRVIVSSRTAVILFLEGVLSKELFKKATEGIVDVGELASKEHVVPAITIPEVTIGKYKFPVVIVREFDIKSSMATFDKEGKIV